MLPQNACCVVVSTAGCCVWALGRLMAHHDLANTPQPHYLAMRQQCRCAGLFNECPADMGVSSCYAAPEMILDIVVECTPIACKHCIDARAQDVFSLLCF